MKAKAKAWSRENDQIDLTFDEKKQPRLRQCPQSKRRFQEKVHQRFLDVIELVDEGTQTVRQRRRHFWGLGATSRRLTTTYSGQAKILYMYDCEN